MSGGAEHEERAYVYMVRCAGGQLYTGWTNDPGARLHAHKTGKGAKATRAMGAKRFAYLERPAPRGGPEKAAQGEKRGPVRGMGREESAPAVGGDPRGCGRHP